MCCFCILYCSSTRQTMNTTKGDNGEKTKERERDRERWWGEKNKHSTEKLVSLQKTEILYDKHKKKMHASNMNH